MKKIMPKFLVLAAFIFIFSLDATGAQAKDVDWAAINPDISGATFVNDTKECWRCHKDYMATFAGTTHGRIFRHNPRDEKESLNCEACHGPMSKHLNAPRNKPPLAVSFKTIDNEQKNQICAQCHVGGKQIGWKGSPHQRNGVACINCHYVMERRSDRALAINEDIKKACYNCHPEKKAKNLRASHMPIKEGKIACSNCHNPHGSPNPKLLKAGSVNDLCYSCHAEKRGPFLWEHAVVRENCSNCHDPHGSNNPALLNAKGAFLCTQCHQYGGHVNMPRYNRTSAQYGQGCVNCHNRIHGSNHPSGAKFTR